MASMDLNLMSLDISITYPRHKLFQRNGVTIIVISIETKE